MGFPCTGCTFFFFFFNILLDHLDPEGDAAQVLIPLVVVAQVRALYPALHLQLLVVVLLCQQQLHGHQGLQVIVLHRGGEGDGRLSITPHRKGGGGGWADMRRDTYVGFLAIIGEVHLIEARIAGEILQLRGIISLSRRAAR